MARSIGYVSDWYSLNVNEMVESFLHNVQLGDAIEINRGNYSHWGIYVCVSNGIKLRCCIVHASSPENANSGNVILTSASVQKRASNLGIVALQPIEDVVKDCKFKINNSMDSENPPFDQQKIVERAFAAIQVYDEYHLLRNNCEHFANWCRNGVKSSYQVLKVVKRVFVGLSTAILVLLPFA